VTIQISHLKPVLELEDDEYSNEETEKLEFLLFGYRLCVTGFDDDVAGTTPLDFVFS
jgi:hypothetical protein